MKVFIIVLFFLLQSVIGSTLEKQSKSSFSGHSWEELLSNFRKHTESGAIDKEWEELGKKERARNSANNLISAAISDYNMEKNRYGNILPYDSTRVKLAAVAGIHGSDYINANHITIGERVYIAAQAPIESTVADFHRMLWENDVKIIVMLTRFVEGGMEKATEYFPQLGSPSETYGDIKVKILEEESIKNSYIVRKISVEKGGEQRIITQFHYLAWPDFGIPSDPLPLMEMMLRVEELHDGFDPSPPMAVHCSAGIGRTGAYIVVNAVADVIDDALRNGNA